MVSWSRFSLALAVTIGGGVAHRSSAQTAHLWSADATIGDGTGHGGEYFDDGRIVAHLALGKFLVKRGKLAVYAEAGYEWLGLGAVYLTCPLNSSGGCRPHYPSIAGPSASTGVLFAPWTRLEARAGVGGAAYSVDGTRVGAVVGQLDAAVFPQPILGWSSARDSS
ncbi:MAG TPA: hypothetical protein VGH98_06350 [Gemmatimonadaceae bacterium]|jgi:hypothetical protein